MISRAAAAVHLRATPCIGLVLLLSGVPAVPGCTRVSDRDRFEPNAEPLRIHATVPEAGATQVPANVRIDVCFSRLVDPRSLGSTDAVIASGQTLVDTQLQLALLPWQAPGSNATDTDERPWCRGSVLRVTPKIALAGGVLYRMRLAPTIRGWEGESLDLDQPGWIQTEDGMAWDLELTVATTEPEPWPEPAPPVTLRDLIAGGGPLDPGLGRCSCHLDRDDLAHALLDLSTPRDAFAALLGSSRLRDTGFSMISPRQPSQSFFVHKLLRDDDGEPLHGLLGDAMPPDDPLPWSELRPILQWIADGASL